MYPKSTSEDRVIFISVAQYSIHPTIETETERLRQVYSTQHNILQLHDIRHT